MAVSANNTPTQLIVTNDGQKGEAGADGVDGIGFNQVRRLLLDNPTLWIYKKNRLANVLSGLLTVTRDSDGSFFDMLDIVRTETNGFPREGGAGWLIERASENEALYSRDLTDAAWVKTNITATLDAVGNDNIDNTASTLTATAGLGTAFQTITKASAENTYSVDVRRKTGVGTIEITDDGGATYSNITSSINSIDYTRFEITSTQANPTIGFRITDSTDAIEVDYNQLEELSFSTSRILTTTTSQERALEYHRFPVLNNIPFLKNGFSVVFRVTDYNEQSPSQDLLTIPDATSGNVFKINTTPTGEWEVTVKGSDAIDYTATTTINATSSSEQVVIVTVSSIGVINIYIDGNIVNGTETIATGLVGDVNPDQGVEVGFGGDFKANINGLRFYDFELNDDEILYLND